MTEGYVEINVFLHAGHSQPPVLDDARASSGFDLPNYWPNLLSRPTGSRV